MKLQAIQQSRRSNSFRGLSSTMDPSVDGGATKSQSTIFWIVLHGLCCLISLVLGFRFFKLVYFFLFLTHSANFYTATFHSTANLAEALAAKAKLSPSTPANRTGPSSSRVVVGRHGILIRDWPHPNPLEVMKAHRIIERVQREQRLQYGVKNPRTVIAITPTYVRTFQTLHLTGVMQSLMNVLPNDLIWIVVEAGGTTNETASLLAKSGLNNIHIGFKEKMPNSWEGRHKMESSMRLHALRVVRERKLDGIVIFADDSNMHTMELFDEIQKVKWMGAVSVGILAHSSISDEESSAVPKKETEEKLSVPVQGPACNSSGKLVGWHSFNSLPYAERSARFIGDGGIVLPRNLEWAGFVLNSRLLWKEEKDKPNWVKDLDMVASDGEDIGSPISMLRDPSVVEPLGNCGRKILLWWLRVEARADSKFPDRWIIVPPLEKTMPAKRTPWPGVPSREKVISIPGNMTEKHVTKPRTTRSRHSSKNKRKHEHRSPDNTRVPEKHSVEE